MLYTNGLDRLWLSLPPMVYWPWVISRQLWGHCYSLNTLVPRNWTSPTDVVVLKPININITLLYSLYRYTAAQEHQEPIGILHVPSCHRCRLRFLCWATGYRYFVQLVSWTSVASPWLRTAQYRTVKSAIYITSQAVCFAPGRASLFFY